MSSERRFAFTFKARNDDGKEYTIEVYRDVIVAEELGGKRTEVEDPQTLMTSHGQAVNRLGKGKYAIVQTGEVLSSDDPNAP